jgi:hypothetical protein
MLAHRQSDVHRLPCAGRGGKKCGPSGREPGPLRSPTGRWWAGAFGSYKCDPASGVTTSPQGGSAPSRSAYADLSPDFSIPPRTTDPLSKLLS